MVTRTWSESEGLLKGSEFRGRESGVTRTGAESAGTFLQTLGPCCPLVPPPGCKDTSS